MKPNLKFLIALSRLALKDLLDSVEKVRLKAKKAAKMGP